MSGPHAWLKETFRFDRGRELLGVRLSLFSKRKIDTRWKWGVGEVGGGAWLNNVLYGEVPPLGLNPYTFIVEGARRVCLGLEFPRTNFNVTQFLEPPV